MNVACACVYVHVCDMCIMGIYMGYTYVHMCMLVCVCVQTEMLQLS